MCQIERKANFLKELTCENMKASVVAEIRDLRAYLNELEKFISSPDESNKLFAYRTAHNESGLLCNENSWTKRLVGGLQRFMQKQTEVIYSAESKDFKNSVTKHSRLHETSSFHHDMAVFHGTPDLIIKDYPVTVNLDSDSEMVSDEDDEVDLDDVNNSSMVSSVNNPAMVSSAESEYLVGKVTKQANNMNVLHDGLAEKSGELLANMFWLAECKIIKRLRKGKPLKKTTNIEGMLIDRQHGAVILLVKFQISPFGVPNLHQLSIINEMSGIMDTEVLCGHITKLLEC